MREHLFELSVSELKDLYMHETRALTFALEAGVPWEDLEYIRASIKDITKYIDARMPRSMHILHKRNGDFLPLADMSPARAVDSHSINYQPKRK